MYSSNPYAQAGWHNPQNPYSINDGPWRPNAWHAPTFGALPPPSQGPTSVWTFEFNYAAASPDVLNCTVIGPKDLQFFNIQTDSTSGSTLISKPTGLFAEINWNKSPTQRPTVEAKGIICLQRAGEFLRISSDHTSRAMLVAGKSYTWIPRTSGIYLFSAGPSPPQECARASISKDMTKILLEITGEAFQAGIFEPCIIATTLLFCGRRFD